MRLEPLFQIRPGIDFVVDWTRAALDHREMTLQYFVYEAFFALEIVVELPLPGTGSFNDFVRAGSAHSLFVKQVCCNLNDAESCLGASNESRFHSSLQLYQHVHSDSQPTTNNRIANILACT